MEEPKSPNAEPKWLDEGQAIEAAKQAIEKIGIKQWSQCSVLNDPKVVVHQPFVVEERSEQADAPPKTLYVVPHGIEGEQDENGAPLAHMCILLDAATGEFEEMTKFGKPIAYLTKDAALEVVAAALGVDKDALKVKNSSWVHQPGEISNLRAVPFWKISVGERDFFVDHKRLLHTHVRATRPGN